MSCDRRQFLTGTLALIGITAVAGTKIVSSKTIEGKRLAMVHDESRCIGCTACESACREVNQLPDDVSRLRIERTGPFGEHPNKYYRFYRHSCQHCDNAPCVTACPTGAAFKDEKTGIVDVNPDRCVGCQYCIAACPYQVRYIDPVTRSADKCDFCRKTNLAQGRLPGCVEACPTKALIFGDLNDPRSEVSLAIKQNPVYRSKLNLGTKPKLYRIPGRKGEINA